MPRLLAVGLLALAATAVADRATARALSEPQIAELLSDTVAKGKSPKGKPYTIKYNADRTATFAFDDGSFSDLGRWDVENGAYCMTWVKIRRGVKGCWNVIALGSDVYNFVGLGDMDDVTITIAP